VAWLTLIGRPFSYMLYITHCLTKYINLWSSIDFTEQLEVSSGAAAAVSLVHLRSENTRSRRIFEQRIVVGKHPGPCRTPTWTVLVSTIHCRDIIGLD